jgi:opacity protein-like surface antigen
MAAPIRIVPQSRKKGEQQMNHKPKALCLTFLVALATAALGASAAHATVGADFWADDGAFTIDTVAETSQVFTTPTGSAFVCTTVDAHTMYEGQSPELTGTDIGYTNCHTTAFGVSFPTTITPAAGCHFTFTAGTYTPTEDLSHGSLHICPITMDIYNDAAHTQLRCQMHFFAQTIPNVTYRNITTPGGLMAVTIELNKVPLHETRTNHGTLGCSAHAADTATYTGNLVAEATNALGEVVDTTVIAT